MSLCGDVDAAGIRMPLHRFAGTIRRNKHRDDRAHGRLQNLLAQNDVRAGEPSRRWEARWNKWKGQVGERASVLAAGTIAEGARDRTARDAGHMGGCDVAVLVIAPGRDETVLPPTETPDASAKEPPGPTWHGCAPAPPREFPGVGRNPRQRSCGLVRPHLPTRRCPAPYHRPHPSAGRRRRRPRRRHCHA